jgi:predicted  nucleic acid-binding Zn-ribbon protein
MDEKVLELLNAIHKDITELKGGQQRIEKKLDAVVDQTADLTEFRTETKESLAKLTTDVEAIRKDLSNVEIITSSNWNEIAKLKAVK